MIPVFIDFETYYDKHTSLKSMSLRRYLAATHVTMLAVQIGVAGHPCVITDVPTMRLTLEHCRAAGSIFIAHNTAFDARVAKYKLGVDWFEHERCTLDMAQRAFPSWPGGYSLANLSKTLPGIPAKLDIDLTPGKHTPQQLADYCAADVRACAALYQLCLSRTGPAELALAEATARARRLSLRIDATKGAQAVATFQQLVADHGKQAGELLGLTEDSELAEVFGMDGGRIKSIKPHGLKSRLFESFGFHTETVSRKKINPEKLRRDPAAAAVLEAAGKANATLSHIRNVAPLLADSVVDVNLSHFGSHTGRWTSKRDGKGVNFLNLPKHDKLVAKPIRSMLSVDGCVLVRGDLASLEYRMVGAWCRCEHTVQLYTKNVLADAYCAFGEAATGKKVDKKDPARQVWKTAVLGLSFLMAVRTHALNLAKLLAAAASEARASGKPPKISLADFEAMVQSQGWTAPTGAYYTRIRRELGLAEAILTVAFHTHKLFHTVHPEIKRTADWFEGMLRSMSGTTNPQKVMDHWLLDSRRPPMLGFTIDTTEMGLTLKLTCGPWPEHTLVWRDIGVRADAFGQIGLCSATAKRGYRQLSPNIIVENCWSGDTEVLTEGGWCRIDSVPSGVRVWDGIAWVITEGTIYQGRKETIAWHGNLVTPKQRILCGNGWQEAAQANHHAALKRGESAMKAAQRHWRKHGQPDASSLTVGYAPAGPTDSRAWCLAVPIQGTKHGPGTEGGALPCGPRGSEIGAPSTDTPSPCRDGINRDLIWTASTTPKATAPATSGSLPEQPTPETREAPGTSDSRAAGFPCPTSGNSTALAGEATTLSPTISPRGGRRKKSSLSMARVYDLKNCGPRHRFLARCKDGSLVVSHNCTQAMGRNAVAMGMLELEKQGYGQLLNVHDEVLIPVPPDCTMVLQARDALARVFAPGGHVAQAFGWAGIMDPTTINVTRSLYEDDDLPVPWARIAAGDATALDMLS